MYNQARKAPVGAADTYVSETSSEQLFERDVEIGLYIDCPSVDGTHTDVEDKELVGALVRGLVVDVYHKDGQIARIR